MDTQKDRLITCVSTRTLGDSNIGRSDFTPIKFSNGFNTNYRFHSCENTSNKESQTSNSLSNVNHSIQKSSEPSNFLTQKLELKPN